MRNPASPAGAAVHSNRRQPLLFQFPLKPGPATWLRMSQARGRHQMFMGCGDILDRPLAFAGTAGVMRFSRDAGAVLDDVIASGLEHHIALAYGDHRETLRGAAGAFGLPLLEL